MSIVETGDFVVFFLPTPTGGMFAYTGVILGKDSNTFLILSEMEYAESIDPAFIIPPIRKEQIPVARLIPGEESPSSYMAGFATIEGQEQEVWNINPMGDELVAAFKVPKENILLKLPKEMEQANFTDVVDEVLRRLISPFSFFKVITKKEFPNWVYTDDEGNLVTKKTKREVPRRFAKKVRQVSFSFGLAVEIQIKWAMDFGRGKMMFYQSLDEVPEKFKDKIKRKIWVPPAQDKSAYKVFWQSDRCFEPGLVWAKQPCDAEIKVGDYIAGIPYQHPKGDKLALFMPMSSDQILAWSSFEEFPLDQEAGIKTLVTRTSGKSRTIQDKDAAQPWSLLPIPNYMINSSGAVRDEIFQDLTTEHQRLQRTIGQMVAEAEDPKDPKVSKYRKLLALSLQG